jgi:hypothetical protein
LLAEESVRHNLGKQTNTIPFQFDIELAHRLAGAQCQPRGQTQQIVGVLGGEGSASGNVEENQWGKAVAEQNNLQLIMSDQITSQ